MLIAIVPHLCDDAIDNVENLHARDAVPPSVLVRDVRLIDDRGVLATTIARNYDREAEVYPLGRGAVVLDSLSGLLPGQADDVINTVPDDAIGKKLISEREIALIPDLVAVEFHHFTSRTCFPCSH